MTHYAVEVIIFAVIGGFILTNMSLWLICYKVQASILQEILEELRDLHSSVISKD
jgi:hypothetical protein